MEELEERYREHEIPRSTKELFISEDAVAIFLTENCRELLSLQKKNKKHIKVNKIAQKILTTDRDLLQIDEVCLKEYDSLYSNILNMLSSLYSILDNDNYLELGKLIDFILMIYSDNSSAILSKRRAIKYHKKGIEFIDNRFKEIKMEDLEELFQKVIMNYKNVKVLEKKRNL